MPYKRTKNPNMWSKITSNLLVKLTILFRHKPTLLVKCHFVLRYKKKFSFSFYFYSNMSGDISHAIFRDELSISLIFPLLELCSVVIPHPFLSILYEILIKRTPSGPYKDKQDNFTPLCPDKDKRTKKGCVGVLTILSIKRTVPPKQNCQL